MKRQQNLAPSTIRHRHTARWHTVSTGWCASMPTGALVMTAASRSSSNDSGRLGRAWFDATDPKETASKDHKKECQSCHAPARASDWIYTGYPPQRRVALMTCHRKPLLYIEPCRKPGQVDHWQCVERLFYPCKIAKRQVTAETLLVKLKWYGHSVFRIEARAGEDSTQGGR